MGFPWRYTIGKEEVWQRWNILQPLRKLIYPTLRLTYPPSSDLKTFFKVSKRSTIL
jgi:hypothetical protein